MSGKNSPDSVALNFLHTRLQSEHNRGRQQMYYALVDLQQRIKSALAAIELGEPLDAHLIANAAMLTEMIARWNLALDLIPAVKMCIPEK